MPTSYDVKYRSWLHEIRREELSRVCRSLSEPKLDTVLEVGCGDGFQSRLLDGHCVRVRPPTWQSRQALLVSRGNVS